MAEWLEFGAMGVLAAVLVALGAWLRSWMASQGQRQLELDQAETKRRERQDDFMRELVESDRQERKAQVTLYQELLTQDVEAKQELAEVMRKLVEAVRQSQQQSEERHAELLANLQSANGKTTG